MIEQISLKTHVLVWHTSPSIAHNEIDAEGIRLFKEYIWCSMGPWMPIGFAKKFTGNFDLSFITLPRMGEESYLWAETRRHPNGDPGEKTFDHGGGHNSEVKLWTRIPRSLIKNIWTQDEVDQRLSASAGDVTGQSFKSRTAIEMWLPGVDGFQNQCAAILVNDKEDLDTRLHAGLYLRTMGLLTADPDIMVSRQQALMDIVCTPGNWIGDKLATSCHLLTAVQPVWMYKFLVRAHTESLPSLHTARVFAFACFLHRFEETNACMESGLCSGVTKVLAHSLPRIVNSKGTDVYACKDLAALGADVAGILLDLLLGLPLANAVSNALIKTLGMMPVETGTPVLIALLRRRRDVSSKARNTINGALSAKLPFAEASLLNLARSGHWHSRRAARQILLHHGSQNAIKQVESMLVNDDTETIDRRKKQ